MELEYVIFKMTASHKANVKERRHDNKYTAVKVSAA
jgi:hypothetical protein